MRLHVYKRSNYVFFFSVCHDLILCVALNAVRYCYNVEKCRFWARNMPFEFHCKAMSFACLSDFVLKVIFEEILGKTCHLKCFIVICLVLDTSNDLFTSTVLLCTVVCHKLGTMWRIFLLFSAKYCDQTNRDIAMGPTASKNLIFLFS